MGRRWRDRIPDVDRRKNRVLSLGPFQLDERRKTVSINGDTKSLPPKLFDLLKIFVADPGKVLSPEELAANLWSVNERSDPTDVKQYVYLLRKAIEPDPAQPRWLRNVRGFGYELIID